MPARNSTLASAECGWYSRLAQLLPSCSPFFPLSAFTSRVPLPPFFSPSRSSPTLSRLSLFLFHRSAVISLPDETHGDSRCYTYTLVSPEFSRVPFQCERTASGVASAGYSARHQQLPVRVSTCIPPNSQPLFLIKDPIDPRLVSSRPVSSRLV